LAPARGGALGGHRNCMRRRSRGPWRQSRPATGRGPPPSFWTTRTCPTRRVWPSARSALRWKGSNCSPASLTPPSSTASSLGHARNLLAFRPPSPPPPPAPPPPPPSSSPPPRRSAPLPAAGPPSPPRAPPRQTPRSPPLPRSASCAAGPSSSSPSAPCPGGLAPRGGRRHRILVHQPSAAAAGGRNARADGGPPPAPSGGELHAPRGWGWVESVGRPAPRRVRRKMLAARHRFIAGILRKQIKPGRRSNSQRVVRVCEKTVLAFWCRG
jgi:hypothetical protein